MISVAETSYGLLEGVNNDGYVTFKGVPYAKAPVGDLRWKRPVKMEKWNGIRKADSFGNIAIQLLPDGEQPWSVRYKKEFYDDPKYIPSMSEDCLFLNIWTPAENPGDKLPIAFWIHGGGFGGGYSSEIEFDGEAFAKKGIILVTVNYRVGAFGFLAHPWLTEESEQKISGNYGIYDQIAALEWIYENASAFGGDPENITVFGQSAGCISTQVLISSELTGNKIKKAILQSGVTANDKFIPTPKLEKEEEYGKMLVDLTGAKNLEELRKLTAEEIMSAKGQFDLEIMRAVMTGRDTEGSDFIRLVPNIDGVLLKKNVREVFREGSMKKIPYMVGCVEDDLGTTDEDRAKRDPGMLAKSDREWCLRQEELGNPPAFCYEFKHKLPTEDGEEVPFHSAELWYMMGTLSRCWRPMNEQDYAVSDEMVTAWANFMKYGNPNDEADGDWKPYTASAPYVKVFT